MDVMNLLREAWAAGLSVRVEGDKLHVTGPKSAEAIVRKLGERKAEVMAALSPPEPTPDDWTNGRNIRLEVVGWERWQYGGRPHVLRLDLRELWLTTYVEAMQVVSEPEAWNQAWSAVENYRDDLPRRADQGEDGIA